MKDPAISIVKKLRQEGYSAYFAGGCVRDQLMGIPPKDYDVATNARPSQVMRMFPRTVAVGAEFGVVLVLTDEHQVEVATFRSDGNYADGRHPDEVILYRRRQTRRHASRFHHQRIAVGSSDRDSVGLCRRARRHSQPHHSNHRGSASSVFRRTN